MFQPTDGPTDQRGLPHPQPRCRYLVEWQVGPHEAGGGQGGDQHGGTEQPTQNNSQYKMHVGHRGNLLVSSM